MLFGYKDNRQMLLNMQEFREYGSHKSFLRNTVSTSANQDTREKGPTQTIHLLALRLK